MARRRASGQPGLTDRVRWGNLGRLAALLAAGLAIGISTLGGGEPPTPPPGAEPILPQAGSALGALDSVPPQRAGRRGDRHRLGRARRPSGKRERDEGGDGRRHRKHPQQSSTEVSAAPAAAAPTPAPAPPPVPASPPPPTPPALAPAAPSYSAPAPSPPSPSSPAPGSSSSTGSGGGGGGSAPSTPEFL